MREPDPLPLQGSLRRTRTRYRQPVRATQAQAGRSDWQIPIVMDKTGVPLALDVGIAPVQRKRLAMPHEPNVAIGVAGPAYAGARKSGCRTASPRPDPCGANAEAPTSRPRPDPRDRCHANCASAQSTNSSPRTQGRRPAGRECWESIIGAARARAGRRTLGWS